jgi:hypothetical protein
MRANVCTTSFHGMTEGMSMTKSTLLCTNFTLGLSKKGYPTNSLIEFNTRMIYTMSLRVHGNSIMSDSIVNGFNEEIFLAKLIIQFTYLITHL